jgi:cytochrome oxidase assembly protein ShyY1
MYEYHDWHLVRELLILLVTCLFVVYAVLMGVWQERKPGRMAARIAQQDHTLPLAPTSARKGDGRAAETRPARWEEMPVPDSARQVA